MNNGVKRYPPIKKAIMHQIGINKNNIAISIAKLWVNTVYISNDPISPPLTINMVQNNAMKIIQIINHVLYLFSDLKNFIFVKLPFCFPKFNYY